MSKVAGLAKVAKTAASPALRRVVRPLGVALRAAAQGPRALRSSGASVAILTLLKERGRVRVKEDGSVEVAFTVVKAPKGKGTAVRAPRPDDTREGPGKG